MIGLLKRYIARRYLSTFAVNFIAVVVLIFLVDFSENARRFSSSANYATDAAMLLSILHVPALIQISIPFVVLVATITTLLSLNRKYELVIAKASGMSAWQFLMPIVLSNFFIGVLSVAMLSPLGAHATQKASELVNEIGFGYAANNDGTDVPWIRQITDEGTTIIGGRSTSDNGRILNDVTLIRLNNDDTIGERIEAKQATLTEGFWVLENAQLFRNGQNMQEFDLAKLKTNLQPQFIEETFVSSETVSFFDLSSKIEAAESFGLEANVYSMKWHQLVALPALLIAMTMIAAMVSLTFVRFGQSLFAILGGILAGFLLYIMSELITAFGEAGLVPTLVAAWVPVLIAATLGATVLLHKEDG